MLPLKVLEIFEDVKKEKGIVAVVEGKRDEKALSFFGFDSVVSISGRPLEVVVEKIYSLNPQQVAILTDFDEEGENLASSLSKLLSSFHGMKINHSIRKKFKSLKIHAIEELNSVKKLCGVSHGEIGSIYNKIFNRSRFFSRRYCGKTRCDWSNIWSNRGFVGKRS